MITTDQLVCHAVGDYILQSDWMATEKTKQNVVALTHAMFYLGPFLLLKPTSLAMVVIFWSHFAIDRWGLARYLVWAKNWLGYGNRPWSECKATGYSPDRPPWLSAWLLIIADNTMHVICNGLALRYL